MINKMGLQAWTFLWQACRYHFGRVKFPLPDLGQKIKEGTVKKLYVKQGDRVQQFQKIADVESDKQFTQITAPEVGVIAKIYYQQRQVCKVGDLFMEIQSQASHEPTQKQTNKKEEIKKQEIAKRKPQDSKQDMQSILASPVVKMYAKQNNVNLVGFKGSGKRGRVLKEDVINYIENKEKQNKNKQNTPKKPQQTKAHQSKTITMNAFQKGMKKSMTEAATIPHLYYHESMDVTELDSMRQKIKHAGLKVTVMGILTKTFSLALNEHPKMNSTYRADKNQFQYMIHQDHNISLAIDTPNGLVVPNIKNVQSLSIMQIQQKLGELKKLSDAARLTKQHLEGGTICLSNIGTIAGVSASPLILAPQVCIVAIGKVVETPYYVGSTMMKRKFMTMSFGCDHRVVDGASVAKFSNTWKNILQNPYVALAKMR